MTIHIILSADNRPLGIIQIGAAMPVDSTTNLWGEELNIYVRGYSLSPELESFPLEVGPSEPAQVSMTGKLGLKLSVKLPPGTHCRPASPADLKSAVAITNPSL